MAPSSRFERQGDDLRTKVTAPLQVFLFGGHLQVPTPDGRRLELSIPPGTQDGRVFRLRDQGMPRLSSRSQRGDLYAEVHVQLPEHLTSPQRELVEKLTPLSREPAGLEWAGRWQRVGRPRPKRLWRSKRWEMPRMNTGPERIGYYRIEVATRLVGMRPAQIRRCLRSGLVSPSMEEHGVPQLGESELARLRKIRRLMTDVGLNRAGVEIVLRLLDEIDALRAEVRRVRGGYHHF